MFNEPAYRYRVIRHEELPEAHKAAYREAGINPDDNWQLIWSFKDRDAAQQCLDVEVAGAAKWQTYRLVDAKEAGDRYIGDQCPDCGVYGYDNVTSQCAQPQQCCGNV